MAAYTFAALFLAHVIADYLLQSSWLVANKRRAIAMAIHISLVFAAMCLTTLSFSPWFLALTLAHLWIDVVKTFALRDGLFAYTLDQLLHVLSIVAVSLLAPQIWPQSPLSDVAQLPLIYMIVAGVLFAARGGQYAVEMLVASRGPGSGHGIWIGWAERGSLCIVLIGGLPLLALAVLGAKAVHLALSLRTRTAEGRARLLTGSAVSIAWGLAVALPLMLAMPMMR